MRFEVEVNNVPEKVEEYVVARFSPETKSLWYWGSWADREQAIEIGKLLGGIVVRRVADEENH